MQLVVAPLICPPCYPRTRFDPLEGCRDLDPKTTAIETIILLQSDFSGTMARWLLKFKKPLLYPFELREQNAIKRDQSDYHDHGVLYRLAPECYF